MDTSESEVHTTLQPESISQKLSNLHMEFGFHESDTPSLFTNTTDENKKNLKKGELDPHFWNEAIGSRLRRIEPQILAIDSLEPVVSLDLNRSLSHSEQISVWRHLPVRPSKLNQKGEVLVVCGDILYRTPKAAGRILGFEADKQEKLSNLLNKKDDSTTSDLRTDIQMETGAPLILSLMLAIGGGTSIGRMNNVEQKNISRRNILKGITGLGAAGVASVLAGKSSIYGASCYE